jgi:hypothetical protein
MNSKKPKGIFMKILLQSLIVTTSLLLSFHASADETPGFFYKGQSMADKATAEAFFKDFLSAQETDEDVEVCYSGNWEEALNTVNEVITIYVNDIYGEGEGAALDVDIDNEDAGESTYGIISGC